MAATIQVRRGTAAALSAANPTPVSGEIVWEEDTNKLKVGDGTNQWSSLLYAEGSTASQGVVNVKDFGAAGNGVADDTQAVASAVAVVASGGTVLFPPGTYKITQTLTFSNLSGVTLKGLGKSSVLHAEDPSPVSPATAAIDCLVFDRTCSNVELESLSFIGACTADEPDPKSSVLFKGPQCVVRNCFFKNFNNGILIRETDTNLPVIATDCKVLNSVFEDIVGKDLYLADGVTPRGEVGYAVFTVGKRTTISGNTFLNVWRHDIYLPGAAFPNGGAQCCIVRGNTSQSCQFVSIALNAKEGQPGGSSFHVIEGNTIRDCQGAPANPGDPTGPAIAISNNSFNNVVSNNTILNSGGPGIKLEGADVATSGAETYDLRPSRNVIIGNIIHDSGGTHVSCINGSFNLFVGNVISSEGVTAATQRGIEIGDSGSLSLPVEGNIIGDNIYSGLSGSPFVSSLINSGGDPAFGVATNPTTASFDQGGVVPETAEVVFLSAPETIAASGYSLRLPIPSPGRKVTFIRTDGTSKKIAILGDQLNEPAIDGTVPTYSTSSYFPASTPGRRLTVVSDGTNWYSISDHTS